MVTVNIDEGTTMEISEEAFVYYKNGQGEAFIEWEDVPPAIKEAALKFKRQNEQATDELLKLLHAAGLDGAAYEYNDEGKPILIKRAA